MLRWMRIFVTCIALLVPVAAKARDVTLVISFAPGGTSSLAGQLLADGMKKQTGDSVVPMFKPGVGGRLAADFVRDEPGDGATLLVLSSTSISKIPPGIIRPVALIGTFPYVIAVSQKVTADTVRSFAQNARTSEWLQLYAAPGHGTLSHLIGELLARDLSVPLRVVQFKGSAEAVQQTVGSHVAMTVVPMPDYLPYEKQLRALGITGGMRSAHLPNAPTLIEQDINVVVEGWIGVFAPHKTPAETIHDLNKKVNAALAHKAPELLKFGFLPQSVSADMLEKRHRVDFERWSVSDK
jgi:tripartite-type tricarboxylate transporter receptor subunit TctC